ncbi:MAG: hypothetical protein H7232_16265 [Aeromicrobium sp.]|nr:hypothetical protein [Burkholderiales bacterium]
MNTLKIIFGVAGSVLLSFAGAAFGQAATVAEVVGKVEAAVLAEAPRGTKTGAAPLIRLLRKGDFVDAGEVVATGPASSVVLQFLDGQVVALSADSSAQINAYAYDAQNAANSKSLITHLEGGMEFATGLIAASRPEQVTFLAGSSVVQSRGGVGQILISFDGDGSVGMASGYGNGYAGIAFGGFGFVSSLLPAAGLFGWPWWWPLINKTPKPKPAVVVVTCKSGALSFKVGTQTIAIPAGLGTISPPGANGKYVARPIADIKKALEDKVKADKAKNPNATSPEQAALDSIQALSDTKFQSLVTTAIKNQTGTNSQSNTGSGAQGIGTGTGTGNGSGSGGGSNNCTVSPVSARPQGCPTT